MKYVHFAIGFLAAVGCANTDTPPTSAPAAETPTSSQPAQSSGPERGLKQGESYWAVYVHVGEPGAKLDEVVKMLQAQGLERGVEFSDGQLNCDTGAAEALGVSPEAYAVGVYFASEGDAKAYAATLSPPPVGIASVKISCAD